MIKDGDSKNIPGSIGEYISRISYMVHIHNAFELAAYVQKWASLLEKDYQELCKLPMSNNEAVNVETRIDEVIKNNYADVLKNTNIMAKVLGMKE